MGSTGLPREVSRVSGQKAFELFEKAKTALARAMLSSKVVDPDKVTAIRYDDDSVLWIFELENEDKAKGLVNWVYNTLTALKDMMDIEKVTKTKVGNKDVIMVYTTYPNFKESYPSAFWSSGNKFFWLESGHDTESFEELLWELLGRS
ncbi:hypothetical protein Igni_0054 [Ignicoccus hospitalis KIN4/I]|uniref:Uncharacterized protein n=2 Tax=Ignicoccus TaxID=54258 RepID=A8A8I6_IGNH4|nr:hypothetical protein Igni_0054 [Ignicoccus hospitalis KIN4/I]